MRPQGRAEYQQLKSYAEESGRWGEMHDRALDRLRERIASARDERRELRYGWSWLDATELVRIRLWEGDTTAALREAREGGCRPEVWLALAEALEEAEPGEAAEIYRERVEPTIGRKSKADYREATDMISKIRDPMARTGQGGCQEITTRREDVRPQAAKADGRTANSSRRKACAWFLSNRSPPPGRDGRRSRLGPKPTYPFRSKRPVSVRSGLW